MLVNVCWYWAAVLRCDGGLRKPSLYLWQVRPTSQLLLTGSSVLVVRHVVKPVLGRG